MFLCSFDEIQAEDVYIDPVFLDACPACCGGLGDLCDYHADKMGVTL